MSVTSIWAAQCAMQVAIHALPDGTYPNAMTLDGYDRPVTRTICNGAGSRRQPSRDRRARSPIIGVSSTRNSMPSWRS